MPISFDGTNGISATGNIAAGSLLSNNYLYANGTPFGGGTGTGNALTNGTHGLVLEADGTLLPTNNGTATTFVINNSTSDIDLRNTFGTGSFTNAGTSYTIRVNGSQGWAFDNTGNLTAPNIVSAAGFVGSGAGLTNISASQLVNGTSTVNIPSSGANVIINVSGADVWTFDSTGNLTLPSTTASINYSNGNPYGVESPFSVQASNFNAVAGGRYGVNTSGGQVIATLPASPVTGQAVLFADAGGAFATHNLIINPGVGSIMGGGFGVTMTVSTNNQSVGLFFNGTTWRIYNAV